MKALETDDEICTIQGELVEGMFKWRQLRRWLIV
jgi:hypothetical protein